MLQIYIYGPTEEGYLDIDPDMFLDMETLADIFDEDYDNSIGEFSLPGDIPWTDKNRRLMGFSERLENFKRNQKSFRVAVYYKLWPEMPVAQLTILEKSGFFSYKRGKFSVSISGSKGLFGAAIKGKKLTGLQLGGQIQWSSMIGSKDSREFATEVMKGLWPQLNYLSFAPVAIETFINTGRADYDGEFLALDVVNNVIVDGGLPDGWVFGRPESGSPAIPAPKGNAEYPDYRTVPFLKFKYVLKKVFEENGYAVSGEFMESTDFDDLHLFNQCAVELYSGVPFPYAGPVDLNDMIKPWNHVPDVLIKDYLKAVFAFFNMFPVFKDLNTVELVYRKRELRTRRVMQLDGLVSAEFVSTMQDTNNERGYKVGYEFGEHDGYVSDHVKEDISNKKVIASVGTVADLAGVSGTINTDSLVYVSAHNMHYVCADATSTPKKWEPYTELLNDFVAGDGERDVRITLSPLCNYVRLNVTSGLYEKMDYCGCRQTGSYINNKRVKVTSDFGLRLFYIHTSPYGYPFSYTHNRDNNNDVIEPYSLAMQGAQGMINFHKDWQDFKDNMEVVKTKFVNMDRKQLYDLKQCNCCEIDNVQFVPYKVRPSIPIRPEMEIEMVPL